MKLEDVNVLVTEPEWSWPPAVRDLFAPRGINSLVAENPADVLRIIQSRRIHTAILDMDSMRTSGLTTVSIIRRGFPLLPCILVAATTEAHLLSRALQLNVFSVISKPVEIQLLGSQLNRLFTKLYDSDIFADIENSNNF